MNRLSLLFLATILSICVVAPSNGQNPQDQAALLRGPTGGGPEVSINGQQGSQVAASPNDPDLGQQQVLKRKEEYQPFSISFSTPIYYTSNVALANSGEMSDLIVAPAVGAYYDPKFTKTFYGHVGIREQLFYYNDNPVFDFGAFDIEVGLTYYLPQFHNMVLRAMYNYDRLTMKDSFDAFFENHAIIINAELPFRFGRAARLAFGVDANVSMDGEPDGPRRHDFDFYIAYGLNLTRVFSIDAVGRVVVRDYVLTDRVDVSGVIALTATYRLTKWWSASAIGSFATNHSNYSVFDYDVFNAGGSMAFNVRF